MAFLIRTAVPADAALLAAVRAAAGASMPGRPTPAPPDEAFFSRLIAAHPALLYVAAAADALAGYLALVRAAHPAVSAQRPMQLRQLYVAPSFQGRGVGSELLLEARGYAEREAHDVLWLGVDEHNTRAIAFYRRHGFVSLGLHPVAAGEHAHLDLLMSCQP